MTRHNADKAHQADKSMDQLTTSMGDISKAGEEASKIIKTIDESLSDESFDPQRCH